MINEVRNTVLAILNKNNYGYISPADFNLFAEQAQLDIFEDYFYAYNYQVNKENARQSGTGYADLKKGYEEVIDLFSITDTLTQSAANVFFMPSQLTTGSDYYFINKVLCGTGLNEAERVGHSKITLLSQSLLTAPSSLYPAYTTESSLMTIYPDTYSTAGDVTCQYIRYPYTPKWTYINITGGEPVFDQSQPDYQDFELPIDDQTDLTMKILQYAGLSIREEAIVGYSAQQEQVENANEK
ncbi:hypothetical protein HN803_07785 [candidate division WWE3 bacterium]|nr:hypothetical protein [candidate division WWE3 bacterium]